MQTEKLASIGSVILEVERRVLTADACLALCSPSSHLAVLLTWANNS